MLDINIYSILAGIIFGIIGWVVYKRGRNNTQIHLVVLGLILMIYPYFTKTAKQDWLIGIILSGIVYYSWNQDSLF